MRIHNVILLWRNIENYANYSVGKKVLRPDCFTLYFVNNGSMESCCIGLETAFIFEEFCMNFFVVVAE